MKKLNRYTLLLVLFFCCFYLLMGNAIGETLKVGPGEQFLFPSVAAKFAKDGDTIEIDAAGNYINDHVKWKRHNLIIRGVNGRPHINNKGFIKNRKGIWIVKGNNIKISNIEFSGAKVKSRNGAAIRLEGRNFHLSDCYIHDNENGIMSGRSLDSEIVIDNCEFAYNGYGKGKTHNIYIGRVKSFTLKNSFSHGAIVGHTVKSRAEKNYILYNRIFEGDSSYAIDISNGGNAIILGNIIYQGQSTKNWALVAYGAEKLKHKVNKLFVVHNSMLSERDSGVFVTVKKGAQALFANNIFSGNAKIVKGKGDVELINNVKGRNIFRKFASDVVMIRDNQVEEIKNKSIEVIDNLGNKIVPENQIVDGKVVKREKTSGQYDIGAMEIE